LDTKYILWQIKLWDRFAKLTPFIIAISATVFYFLGYTDWELITNVCITFFVSLAIAWWFWVIYTMASIVVVLNHSGKSLEEVIDELKEIKKIIRQEKEKL